MKPSHIYFQGEPGAFSEAAIKNHWPWASALGLPVFPEVMDRILADPHEVALLPIENAYAGTVYDVLDLMIRHDRVSIWAEVVQPVQLALLGLEGMRVEDVRRVRSHPMALMQSRAYWQSRGWQMEVATDTAGSARELSQHRWPGTAAIAAPHVARDYGLTILVDGIQDHPDNRTRFWLVAQNPPEWAQEGLEVKGYKTSIVFDALNQPGSLSRALVPFTERNVNLSKVESRPRPGQPFSFQFWVDCEGFLAPPGSSFQSTIEAIAAATERHRILGNYPVLARPER